MMSYLTVCDNRNTSLNEQNNSIKNNNILWAEQQTAQSCDNGIVAITAAALPRWT